MTLLYLDDRFLEHRTGQHPENASRLTQIHHYLEESGLAQRCERGRVEPVSLARLERVHEAEYIAEIAAMAERGGGMPDADTVVSRRSYEVALLAAGAAANATERVLNGEDATALCLVRPPGHHARPRAAMGFCLFDNAAVAARVAVDEFGLDRVLIVDFDVHHGNGTQEIFWQDGRVAYYSIHRSPFYPGTGDSDETGSGPGLGMIRNEPVQFGTPPAEQLKRFGDSLTEFADQARPQLVIQSAGFDAHRLDPVGSLGLETEDFAAVSRIVMEVSKAHCQGRSVSVLEGGYNPPILAQCVGLHLEELLDAGKGRPDTGL